MVKIRKISEIEPTLGFTEFDILEKYRQSFEKSELGRLHSLFPFSELAQQMDLHESRLGRKSYFSPEGKIALMVLKSYTNFSDSQLIEHLNGNIHYQLFCGVQIDPLHPLTNPKIVSAIRQELADRLDIESLQPGRRKEIRLGLDLSPKPGKELHFALKFLPGAALCCRPHDHAHPFGLDLGKQVLEPLALGLVHNLAGYAHMIHRGHQNHHPSRKCDMRGDPGAFGSSLLLQNLHHDLLALLEHIADIHLL